MPPKPSFDVGEKVLCFHGPLLYEAKCLSVDTKEKYVKYFIHYSGWNKNWDEWVPECRVMKYNETNLRKRKELESAHIKSKRSKYPKKKEEEKVIAKKDKEPTTKKTEVSPVQDKTPKPKAKPIEKKSEPLPPADQPSTSEDTEMKDEQEEQENGSDDGPIDDRELEDDEVEIDPPFMHDGSNAIPSVLEDWIVDEHDLINNQKKIVHLPAKYTVEHILSHYVQDKVTDNNLSPDEEKKITDFAKYTRDCFEVLLGKVCLYKFEKPQYLDVYKEQPERRKCEIYGGPHLLRLFTKMPVMLIVCNKQSDYLEEVLEQCDDFIRWLSRNMQYFDPKDYEVVPPQYHRRFI